MFKRECEFFKWYLQADIYPKLKIAEQHSNSSDKGSKFLPYLSFLENLVPRREKSNTVGSFADIKFSCASAHMYVHPDTGVANAKQHSGISNCMREDKTKTTPYLKTCKLQWQKHDRTRNELSKQICIYMLCVNCFHTHNYQIQIKVISNITDDSRWLAPFSKPL